MWWGLLVVCFAYPAIEMVENGAFVFAEKDSPKCASTQRRITAGGRTRGQWVRMILEHSCVDEFASTVPGRHHAGFVLCSGLLALF